MEAMLRRALRQYAGLRQHLDAFLLGEEGDRCAEELKKFLRREPCWIARDGAEDALRRLSVWRTLTIGGCSREELPKIVEKEEFRNSSWGSDLMTRPQFVTSPTPYTIRLGRVRVGDLGFTEAPHTPELWERLGQYFDECPPETGPHLRRIYRDQPMDEWLPVFMAAIAGSDGCPRVFNLFARSDGLWLSALGARPEGRWPLEREIVVRLRE